ncbi:RRP15-like protein [Nylanderia fulva]|uniref:RRP15-like protein n=1 Tax=Nylanderia fulva TaxID=613905 RepID=UPI0010FB0CA0|nr:RRP15-like protein [Nylanderia fulva]
MELLHSDKNMYEEINEDSDDYQENESAELEMENNTDESLPDAKSTSNAGWADAMQKILRTNKPKRKKTIVLAKAKKLCDVKIKEKTEDFEIDGIKNETKIEADVETGEPTVRTKQRIKEKSLGIRVKPSITDRERERMLQKIATRGVVQLFNAVKQQQTAIDKKLSEAGPLERKREQVLKSIDKNAFLDILMGGSKSIPLDNTVKSEALVKQTNNKDKDDKMWDVLRDDFVMGAKLKDWDKKDAEEEDSSSFEDMDSDVD